MKKTAFHFFTLFFMLILLFSSVLMPLAAAKGILEPESEDERIQSLLSFEGYSARADDIFGVRALYSLDRDILSELEKEYKVTVGALVAREDAGFTKRSLRLKYSTKNDTYRAPNHAHVVTVYSTDGRREVDGHFLSEGDDKFALTVSLGKRDMERAQSNIVSVGFFILEKDDAREEYYVYEGASTYGNEISYEKLLCADYMKNRGSTVKMERYISCLQEEIKHSVGELDCPVLVCGVDDGTDLPADQKAIWISYLEEATPYFNSDDQDAVGIKALYIYSPTYSDPSMFTESECRELGITRTFAYMGIPKNQAEGAGMVCVHGGDGHAYASYVLAAIKNGYAAIAIDTEGCRNTTGKGSGRYSEAASAYQKDAVGHKGKDNFSTATSPLREQWLYYAVCDVAMANTVLRAEEGVRAEKVGLTGLSWGGLVTATSICYDTRFAFCVSVYCSMHMSESLGVSVGGLKTNDFAARLWQDTALLGQSPVPTLLASGDRDLFASPNTLSATLRDLQKGTLLFKPGFAHGQYQGASLPELYRYADHILGKNAGFITAEQPTREDGSDYRLQLNIPSDLTDVAVTLNYRTSPITPYHSWETAPHFESVPILLNGDGSINVSLPRDTVLYYISFSGYSEKTAAIEAHPSDFAIAYPKGRIYSSTDIVYME